VAGREESSPALFESPNTCGGPLTLLMVEAIEGMNVDQPLRRQHGN